MGALEKLGSAERCDLFPRHLVGRSELAQLRVADPEVSGEHASIAWSGTAWMLRDLGSRNGTFVDDRRVPPGESVVLRAGDIVRFGSPTCAWRVIDERPPSPAALALDGGPPQLGDGGILALPSSDSPEVSIYRDAAGSWVVDRDGAVELITSGAEIVAGQRRFRVMVPESQAQTGEMRAPMPSIGGIRLRFQVSRDEEHVALSALHPGGAIDLGARSHHYLLLTLARARLRDRDIGRSEPEEGWLYHGELARMLRIEPSHVNIAVFRCRRQIGESGIIGAAEVIERRRGTRQLRLGVRDIEVEAA